MANQQQPSAQTANSAGVNVYPGTDMTGVEMELLRELMRKAERNNMMDHTISLHQMEVQQAGQQKGKTKGATQPQQGGKNSAGQNLQFGPARKFGYNDPRQYDPKDDPWQETQDQGPVPKADPPVLQIFGSVHQGTPPVNLPPAATAMPKHGNSAGFPQHSAAALGAESNFKSESNFPPAKNSTSQLPIPKPSGPNKSAKITHGPTIQEVIDEAEKATGIEIGGRMDEGSKRLRDPDPEDKDDNFGFEYIPEDVSPPWFPNNLWGIPDTVQHHPTDWGDKSWYPDYGACDVDPAIPVPVHVQGVKQWATTKLKLKKFEDKGWSYHEFLGKIFNHDAEAGQYAKWILAHYGGKVSATPKSQAPDLAAFLKKMRVDAFLGATTTYRRELMSVDFGKIS